MQPALRRHRLGQSRLAHQGFTIPQRHNRIECRVQRINPRQTLAHHLNGRDLARGNRA